MVTANGSLFLVELLVFKFGKDAMEHIVREEYEDVEQESLPKDFIRERSMCILFVKENNWGGSVGVVPLFTSSSSSCLKLFSFKNGNAKSLFLSYPIAKSSWRIFSALYIACNNHDAGDQNR